MMRALIELNTLVALEMQLRMPSLSDRKEDRIDPRYMNEDLNVIRVPLERVIGAVLAVELSVPLFGMWVTSVFNLDTNVHL